MNQRNTGIGELIQQKRQSAKLTLKELSEASDISASHLSRIEKNNRFPSAMVLKRIAQPLGLNPNDLFKAAGFLSGSDQADLKTSSSGINNNLDPFVVKVLSQETVEVQRAVIGLITIIKSLSGVNKIK
jgi:transcriptional regulator with XRE-family HTH domain